RGQRVQIRLLGCVLQEELANVRAAKGERAGEQLLKNDGQAVLTAVAADGAVKDLRRRIEGRDSTQRNTLPPFAGQAAHQAKVGHLDLVARDKKIARLDVEMLEAVLEIHEVEGLGRVTDKAQHLRARDAGITGGPVAGEHVVQAAIGQLHNDDQLAVEDLNAFHEEQERVADGLNQLNGFQFVRHGGAGVVDTLQIAVDELDRL